MKAKIKNDKLFIELDLHAERLSSTGKTIGIAGTGGRWRTNVSVDGQPVWVIANAFVYPNSSTKKGEKIQESKAKSRKLAAKPADTKRKPVVIEKDDDEEEEEDDHEN